MSWSMLFVPPSEWVGISASQYQRMRVSVEQAASSEVLRTQQGPRKAPGWGKEGRGITGRVSVALGDKSPELESHLCLLPVPSICIASACLGIYPRELKTYIRRKLECKCSFAVLCVIAKEWKQLKYSSTDEWRDKMYYIHTMS